MPLILGGLAVVLIIGLSVAIVGLTFKLLWTLFIGLIVGLIARALMSGDDSAGFFATSLLGIGGSFTATLLGKLLNLYQPGQSAGFLGSIVGALVLLGIFKMVKK